MPWGVIALMFDKYHRKLISWAIPPPISVIFERKVWFEFDIPNFLQKYSVFEVLGNKFIRHIKTAIRHMWRRVSNGLDNAVLDVAFFRDVKYSNFCFQILFYILFLFYSRTRIPRRQRQSNCRPIKMTFRWVTF